MPSSTPQNTRRSHGVRRTTFTSSSGVASSRTGTSGRGATPGRTGTSSRPAPVRPARRSIWDDMPIQVVPTENLPSFSELGLPPALVAGLSRRGIETPFPIQAATIPDALAGRDVLGRAATGSGKTLGFGLPLIARLGGGVGQPRRPRGLILVPTRELAMQVTDALTPLADARGLTVRVIAGGLPIQKQIQSLVKGVDIVVATPGRLVDLIERRACDLGAVETTVLDEADHMADLGFLPVVRRLLDMTPSTGQRLLFSATLDGDVATLVENYLTDPAMHALAVASASIDTMSHHVYRVGADAKFDLVASIAAREGRTLCFVRTKHGADRLAKNLARAGVAAVVLHGGRSQPQRTKALDAFKDGSVQVLVATDVAARGIHVDDVSLVLHVDPPADPKDYLHRSGRTARAGNSGVVVLLTTPAEERDVRKMLGQAGVQIQQRDASAGDQAVATVTGARRPSGVPIVEARRPVTAQAPAGSRPGGRYNQRARVPRARSSASGSQHGERSSAPGSQHAERRPRRTRGN